MRSGTEMSDLKEKIVKLKDNIDRMNKVFDVLQPIPESDIHECYWKLVDSYIDEIDISPRDSSGYNWLSWFIYENKWGDGDLEVSIDESGWKKVKTIDDLVRIIEMEKSEKL